MEFEYKNSLYDYNIFQFCEFRDVKESDRV